MALEKRTQPLMAVETGSKRAEMLLAAGYQRNSESILLTDNSQTLLLGMWAPCVHDPHSVLDHGMSGFPTAKTSQLALANCLALLCKGIPQTMVVMGIKNFLDIIGCRVTLYFQRVARSLSVSLTCLLSAFQAITISPNKSSLANLKAKAPNGYMMFLLYRHHKQAKQIHITCITTRASPETKATKTILIILFWVCIWLLACFMGGALIAQLQWSYSLYNDRSCSGDLDGPRSLSTFDDNSLQDTSIMESKDIILSVAFFFQTGTGILGNSFLICLFILVFLKGHRMRHIDIIITQLTLVNCLILLSKGIPQTMTALGLMNFFNQIGCKIVFYLHRVARDLSLSMTCLLSGFQAITISPSNSKWADLKARAPKYLIPSSLCCWTFHLFFCSYIPWGMKGPKHTRNNTQIQHNGYCSHNIPSGFQASLFAAILSFPDAIFLGLMISANGYMLFLLYRHHKQIQQVYLTCLSPRVSPENRATKSILMLVSTFISSYSLNCILTAYMSLIKSPPWLVNTSAFLAACFPTVSPYVLISSDSQVTRYCSALCGKKPSIWSWIIE
ncbi:vomeronasal type-1 receptor 4-like [Sarcophilus harrisii]